MDLQELELNGELGRGAMGVVYRARDPRTGREVALKVLLRGSADRLAREGQVVASLDHPGIVRVHEAGVRSGRPCLVYELVEGARSLDELLPTCSRRDAVVLLRDVARALGHAHRQGIVHRDVKPANVLVDAHGRARLTDFGLAGSKELDRLTETGQVLGTPLYMAPETLASHREQVGPPTDVWALGVMLYALLAGREPFVGDSLITLSVQVLSEPLPPIPKDRQAPPALVAVCERALAKGPADRYPDGDAFADELDAFLAGQPTQALAEARRRRRRLAGVAVGGVLVLAAGAGAALALGSRGEAPAGSAAAPADVEPTPSTAPPPPEESPDQRWSAILRLEDRLERYRATCAWLRANRSHARSEDARLSLLNARSAPLLRVELAAKTARVEAVFGPNGAVFTATQGGGTIACWDGEAQRWKHRDGKKRAGVAAWPGGVLGWTGSPVRLWSWTGGADEPARLKAGSGLPRQGAVTPDGALAAVTTNQPEVRIIDLSDGSVRHTFTLRAEPHCLAFSPDGDRLFVGSGSHEPGTISSDAEFAVWDTGTGEQVGHRDFVACFPMALVPAPGTRELYVGTSSGVIDRCTLTGGVVLDFPPVDDLAAGYSLRQNTVGGSVRALVLSPDGTRLHATTNGGSRTEPDARLLVTFDAATGAALHKTRIPDDGETLALSPDGDLLLRGTRSGAFEVWGVAAP